MKKLHSSILVIFLLFSSQAFSEQKIAFIDLDKVISTSKSGSSVLKQLTNLNKKNLRFLKEEEKNEDLFHFITASLQYLDNEDQFSNFHLLFLLKLTRYLGFLPENLQNNYDFFNLESGVFEAKNHGVYSVSGENLTLLKQLLGTSFDALKTVKITANQRQDFLHMLLHYFELHLGSFKKPKSLQVLNEVFH